MADNDPFSSLSGAGKRPWFGPRRIGFGFRPQTWQGVVLMAVLLLPVVILAAVLKPHSPVFVLAVVPAVVVPYIVMAIQRRGGS
jgi:hypothetical protein